MWQVSNMNERLKKNAIIEHIIKKIISYSISSQLNQVCDMKIDTFWRITRMKTVFSRVNPSLHTIFYMLLFHSLFKVKFDIDHFVLGEHLER